MLLFLCLKERKGKMMRSLKPMDLLMQQLKEEQEIFWINPYYEEAGQAIKEARFSFADVADAEARLQRFAAYLSLAFPETASAGGLIESPITQLEHIKTTLEERYQQKFDGTFFLKRDDLLPIAGTIKARGAIYEVLLHAETLALENGLLKSTEEDYAVFASEAFQQFFSQYHLTVGTTGNLGISVGTVGAQLGFNVTVHMSAEAKQWKKDYLRSKGVKVVEHATNFTKAVEKGRLESQADPKSYFVDDEHSQALFLGYAAGGYRMKQQLMEQGIRVDAEHPLFVYLPCGIGGSPGGITFGLKHAFGDHVHCFFAEPAKMPSMLLGLSSRLFDGVSVDQIGLDGLTVADGLAVPRTSGFVSRIMDAFFDGGYTVDEMEFRALQYLLNESEDIFLEPAAVAGISGAVRLAGTAEGHEYLKEKELLNLMPKATHIAWATGGSMVPEDSRKEFLAEGREAYGFSPSHSILAGKVTEKHV